MKFLALVFVIVLASARQVSVSNNFGTGSIEFTADLYKELIKSKRGNFLTCPLSLQLAIGLLNSGARGNTAKQISTSLHLPEGEENVLRNFLKLTQSLESHDNNYILTSANKIYLAQDFEISDRYKQIVKNVFHSEIQTIDFRNTARAVFDINNWVEEKTQHKIKDLMSEASVDANTVAVLLNAIYFQGKWRTPFSEEIVKSRFYLNEHDYVIADMMQVEEQFNYYESSELKASFLEMPYIGEDISMTIVLPQSNEGLPILEARVSEILVAPSYNLRTMRVSIPKFKIETTIDLLPVLTALGITDAFSNNADFSGIGINQNVSISSAIQKAIIEVNEKGTTAAAATGFSTDRVFTSRFSANRPFLFYLKHKGSVVFIGRYSDPRNSIASTTSAINARDTNHVPSPTDNGLVIGHESVESSRVWIS